MNDESSADYCLVSKNLIEDRLVSAKAKAMYAVLCWCPQEFDCSISNLAEVLGVGKETAAHLLKELEEIGYIERNRKKSPNGETTITEYDVFPRSTFFSD